MQTLPSTQAGAVSYEEYAAILRENAELKERETRYLETIKHVKNQMESDKRKFRNINAERVAQIAQKNELEDFFLQCVEEVRKDIIKRKSMPNKTFSKKSSAAKLTKSASNAQLRKQGQ